MFKIRLFCLNKVLFKKIAGAASGQFANHYLTNVKKCLSVPKGVTCLMQAAARPLEDVRRNLSDFAASGTVTGEVPPASPGERGRVTTIACGPCNHQNHQSDDTWLRSSADSYLPAIIDSNRRFSVSFHKHFTHKLALCVHGVSHHMEFHSD